MKILILLCAALVGCAHATLKPDPVEDTYYPYLHVKDSVEMGNLNVVIYDVWVTDQIVANGCRGIDGLLTTDNKFVVVLGAFQNTSLNNIEIVPYIRIETTWNKVVRQIDYDGYCGDPKVLFEPKDSVYLPIDFQPIENGILLGGGVRYWGAIFEMPNDAKDMKFKINNLGNLTGLWGAEIHLDRIISTKQMPTLHQGGANGIRKTDGSVQHPY